MATVMVTCELGGGVGHVVRLAPIVRRLCENGHRVFAAFRDLSQVHALFRDCHVSYFQAPIKTSPSANRIEPLRSFAHILHNTGFGQPDALRTMTEAWRNLYDYVQPDLILCDHSPTALLAARACRAKRPVIGTGFCCPPDVQPFPDFRPWLPDESERLRRDEDQLLAIVNRLLDSWRAQPLGRLSHLYGQVDETFLTTFRELDHYPNRDKPEYYGAWPNVGGVTPVWPDAPGKKVFAYLKPFRALPNLLGLLSQLGRPTVVYLGRTDLRLQSRFESPTLRFQSQRPDLAAVGETCDLVILNGGRGTTASILLAGKPILQIPIHQEQALNSRAVERIGAGLIAPPNRPEELCGRLTAFVYSTDSYSKAACRFAASYSDFSSSKFASVECSSLQVISPEEFGVNVFGTAKEGFGVAFQAQRHGTQPHLIFVEV
jgi:hypothetical protein